MLLNPAQAASQARPEQPAHEQGSAKIDTSCPPSPAGTVFFPFPPLKAGTCAHTLFFSSVTAAAAPFCASLGVRAATQDAGDPDENLLSTQREARGHIPLTEPPKQVGLCQGSGLQHRVVGMQEGAGWLQAQHLLSLCYCGSSNSLVPSPPGPKMAQYEEQHACLTRNNYNCLLQLK